MDCSSPQSASRSQTPARRYAIIGAGWAGLAAAVRLSQAGQRCTVFEASRFVGGRARRVDWKCADGEHYTLDNGQHILLGAYGATLGLMQDLGVDVKRVLMRMPLTLQSSNGLRLRAPRLPAPLHLLAAIALARGLTWNERFAMLRFMQTMRAQRWQLDADQTVADLLHTHQQPERLCTRVWEPLCVAALNTPASHASAQIFLNVLRDSLAGATSASDLLLPRTDLGQVLPDAAAAYLNRTGAGNTLRYGARVLALQRHPDGVTVGTHNALESFDGVVLAVSAQHAAPLLRTVPHCAPLATRCERIQHQSITTIYLRYRIDTPGRWLLPAAMLALEQNSQHGWYGQWAFDRGRLGQQHGLIAVVISADGPHGVLTHQALGRAIQQQLADQAGIVADVIDQRIVVENRATFACLPNLDRPATITPCPGLVLAGDYTHGEYPATLEGAVRSGEQAAYRLMAEPSR